MTCDICATNSPCSVKAKRRTVTICKIRDSLFSSSVSGLCGRLELLQFRRCAGAFPLPLENHSDFFKGLALGLRDPEVYEDGEDEKQPSEDDEHITSEENLKCQSQIMTEPEGAC